jgi:hypothetical protein
MTFMFKLLNRIQISIIRQKKKLNENKFQVPQIPTLSFVLEEKTCSFAKS